MKQSTKPKAAKTGDSGRKSTTLLDVITAVSEASCSEDEVVAVIDDLLKSGRVRLAPGEKKPATARRKA
jgi:adenine/guanine phosphoribosyltransferase-like PRPP-binding protein